ncbi:PAS domain S-box protein, partial [bacterium]
MSESPRKFISTKNQSEKKKRIDEIQALNEKLTLINEELIVTNEELKAYQNKLEELVSIRTYELKKKEESLQYKSRLERLIAGISTRFFNLSPELVDEFIINALKELCIFFNSDAAFLGGIFYSENAYSLTHVWNNENVTFSESYFKKAPLSDIMWWLEKIHEQDHFVVDYRKNNGFKYSLQNTDKVAGIGLTTFIPIIFQGNIVGFTGLSSSGNDHPWTPDEVTLFHQIGEAFVNALKRKESEKILIENERNYREIFNASSEAIIIFDYKNDQVIDVNQAALKLFGLGFDDELHGRIETDMRSATGFDQPGMIKQVKKTIREGSVVFEWYAKRRNVEKFWTEVSLKHTEIAGDLRIIAVIRDITDRKLSQELIMQSEERFRSIVQFLTDIIMIIDEKMNIIYESPSCAVVLGYPPGALIGMNGWEIIHPEDKSLVSADLKEVLESSNDHKPTEFRVRNFRGQ